METQLYNNGTAIYPVTDPESKPLIVTLTGLDNSWTGSGYAFTTNKTTEEIEAASDINVIVPVAIASNMGFTVNNDIVLFPYDKGNKQFIVFAGRTKLYGHFYENSFIVERQSLLTFDDIESSIDLDYLVSPELAASTELVKGLYEDVINSLPFIVSVTTDWSSTTSTTTWEDLYAAYTAGKLIYIIHTDTIETRTYSNVAKMQWAEELKFYTLESGILYILTWNALGITPTNSSLSSLLTLDSTPTINSSNPVTSNGIYVALQNKKDIIPVVEVDNNPFVEIDVLSNSIYSKDSVNINNLIDSISFSTSEVNQLVKDSMQSKTTYRLYIKKSDALLVEELNNDYGTNFFTLTWISDGSFPLNPNVYYKYGTVDNISPTLPSTYSASDEFLYCFTCASDACVITLPQGVVLADNCDNFSEVATGVMFQVSIMDDVAAYLCVTPNN